MSISNTIFERQRTLSCVLKTIGALIAFTTFFFVCEGQTSRYDVFDLGGVVYPESVQWIEKDSTGFIWIATQHGLLRTDGDRHNWVLKGETLRITALKVGGSAIYLGYEDGSLTTIDWLNHQVISRSPAIGSAVSCIYEYSQEMVVYGTKDKGLVWSVNGTIGLMSDVDPTLDLSVHCIGKLSHQLIVATDLGLYATDFTNTPRADRLDISREILEEHYVNAMVETDEGLFLAGENGSLCRLNINGTITKAEYFNAFHKAPILHIGLHEDEVWIVDQDQQILSVHRHHMDRIFAFSQDVGNRLLNAIEDMCINQHGTMMLTTGYSEVVLVDLMQNAFEKHDDIDLAGIDALALASDRYIWIANKEGVFKHHADFIEGHKMRKVLALKGEHVVAFCELNDRVMLAGTFGNGLLVIDRLNDSVLRIDEQSGLINNHITSLVVQGDLVWIATLGGLTCVDSKTWKERARYDENSPMGASYLYAVQVLTNGDICIGTDGKGLIRFREGQFKALRDGHPEFAKTVIQMVEDNEQRLWMVTLDKGIQCLKDHVLQDHPKLSGSQFGELGSIQVYNGNNLLIFCSKGLFRYDPKLKSLQSVKGMRDELSVGFQNMVVDPESRRLWLARKNDLWSCNIDEFMNWHVPHIFVDGILQSLQPVALNQNVFRHDENYLTFLLSIPWFDQTEYPTVRYRLLGLDSNWITTQERIIHYPKLSAGSYELELQVMIQGEVFSGPSTKYAFTILKPFYKRAWFILLCLFLFAFGVAFFLRLRDRRLTRRAYIRQQQLEGELQLLRSQINPHFLFNSFNTLSYTIEKDQNEAVEYVEKLSDYFRLVLQRTREPLITLKQEMNLVEHYLFLQHKRFGASLEVNSRIPEKAMESLIPPMVIQMLLENAVKHNTISSDRKLSVQITVENSFIVVSNNINPLIKKPIGTGTGLKNIQRRVEILMKRDFVVIEDERSFVVKIPLLGEVQPINNNSK
jgi:ligand-binding sensor domain-containing protein